MSTPKERKAISDLADRAYSALQFLNSKTWTSYRDRCFDLALAEERQHRRGKPEDLKIPSSAEACARMFVVKRIAQELLPDGRKATIADVISYQPSAIYAASIVANYAEECSKALEAFDLKALSELDYCKLVGSD